MEPDDLDLMVSKILTVARSVDIKVEAGVALVVAHDSIGLGNWTARASSVMGALRKVWEEIQSKTIGVSP